MPDISDSLRLLFETSIERHDGRYVVPIPKELVEGGSLSTDELYRIALLSAPNATETPVEADSSTTSTKQQSATNGDQSESSDQKYQSSNQNYQSSDYNTRRSRTPPVEEGEVRSVTIDTLGDQGDGIAKVERGFIIIIPGTQPGDEVDVKITDVKKTVAFAEPVSEPTVR
ncbi:TRAM domain-containing protein (plasmid) [Haloferax sp. S1W]|uniref:TRAM domain-containing protein n=1 Tax=Haloferax sp. S1W TaxID=3377110 RepID=UPI0037C53BEA